MQKSDALRAFEIYKLYVKETEGIIGLYEMCKGFANNIPDVDKPPSGVRVLCCLSPMTRDVCHASRSWIRRWRSI
jgi:hypothetical protein